jgi:phosphoglycerate dehydrogenase-like enzyme
MNILLVGEAADHAERLRARLTGLHRILPAGDPGHDEFASVLDQAEVAVSLRFHRSFPPAPRLRLLHVPGSGTDAIDFDALPSACVVCNVYEHEIPIAEYVLLAMLEWVIRYAEMNAAFRSRSWSENYRSRQPHDELAGKTVGVVGYGRIGRAIARRARAFDMRILALTRTPREADDLVGGFFGPDRLGPFLEACDFVVIACPLTRETRGMLGRAGLGRMKRSAVLINVSRAEIVDEAALFEALREQRIAGAVLDVWYDYPGSGTQTTAPSRFPFQDLPGVYATAHSSAWTWQLFERRWAVIADNIDQFASGRPLTNVVLDPRR